MERWTNRVMVVTGASSGIGAAIAEDLVCSGMVVVGLARREDRLKELKTQLLGKPGTLHVLKTDLTEEADVKSAFKWIKDNLGGVDVLVNNAGIFIKGSPCDGRIEDWRRMYEINVLALGLCAAETILSMRERNVTDGHIIVINSIASHPTHNIPGVATYASSKTASKTITEGIHRELSEEGSKIKVTSISPGLVMTEILEANESYTTAEMMGMSHLEAKDIADAVHYVLATPPNVEVTELIIRPINDGCN